MTKNQLNQLVKLSLKFVNNTLSPKYQYNYMCNYTFVTFKEYVV